MEPTNQPFRKENDLNQTSMIMCRMLIFQGVVLRLERPHGKLRRASIEGTQVEAGLAAWTIGEGANEPVAVGWFLGRSFCFGGWKIGRARLNFSGRHSVTKRTRTKQTCLMSRRIHNPEEDYATH